MCVLCELEYKEKISFEIIKPYENTYAKLEKAIETLEKAMGGKHKQLTEVSPYLSMRELEEKSKTEVEKGLHTLFQNISRKWLGFEKANNDPFKLGSDIFINPQTGKPLTKGEWAKMKKDILGAFQKIYGDQDKYIIKSAMALGKILKAMPTKDAIKTPLKDLSIKLSHEVRKVEADPIYANTLAFAEQRTGQLITNLSEYQFTKIHDAILQAQVDRLSARQLETNLFDQFSEMNRDWRMIAETEMANNENNGQLLTALSRATEEKPVFMQGGSSGGACSWCRNMVNNKVVMVVPEPPTGGGDIVYYQDKPYTAVWPGKTNAGRKRSNWWVASGAQHPHCRCYWVEYEPGFEDEWKQLQAAIDEATKDSEAVKKLYEKPAWER
jgi:hypothetical protein